MVAPKLNFFLIGAPKAGTTLIHARLAQHPQVFLSPLKEPNHHSTDIDPSRFSAAFRANTPGDLAGYLAQRPLASRQIGFVRDPADYARLFADAGPRHTVIGECSTSYLWSTEAAENVADIHPEARILAVLRNPVERAHSHWLMARKYGFTRLSLLEAVQQDMAHPDPSWGRSELFVQAGLYAEGLGRWMARFPQDQVKVLLNEELNQPETWAGLESWLGLESAIPEVEGNSGNPAGRARFESVNAWLTRSGIKAFAGRWLPKTVKQAVGRTWYTNEGLRPLSDADRRALLPWFEADIAATESLLDRDLSLWR